MNEPFTGKPGPGTEVADGVYRFGSRRVNWYVVEGEDGLTVVDAGLPAHWAQLEPGLADRGHDLDDVQALVLTHGHPDHVGFAERLRTAVEVPVYVHAADADLARGDGGGAPMGPLVLNLWRPAVIGLLVELARGGGTAIDPIESVESFHDCDTLDVPGDPTVIPLPGHSPGSCAFHLEERDVLLGGDGLATLDIKTGHRGEPQLMSLFNADLDQARDSLDRLADIGEVTLLPGHGDPWHGEMADAVRHARAD